MALNLTRQEQQVILFLISVGIFGLGINFISKTHSQPRFLASFSENLAKINLNQADKPVLMSIPGIGEKIAQRILDYRLERNGFAEIEELKNIKGMTEKKYEKLKSLLYAG